MSVKLLAGTPNDANRDYVPMGIKGTDMTVNENGNNSQVYPQRLRECTGVLADGRVCKFARGVKCGQYNSRPLCAVLREFLWHLVYCRQQHCDQGG